MAKRKYAGRSSSRRASPRKSYKGRARRALGFLGGVARNQGRTIEMGAAGVATGYVEPEVNEQLMKIAPTWSMRLKRFILGAVGVAVLPGKAKLLGLSWANQAGQEQGREMRNKGSATTGSSSGQNEEYL